MTNADASRDLVTVGQTTLSFHQLQDIYHSLTGKTESITKALLRPHRIRYGDLEQLHARIAQACTSYGARTKNKSITIYHVNGHREQFSSFDRFKLYNRSNVSPVENVSMEYNVLIVPAGTDAPKQYRISINLPSRVGLGEKDPAIKVIPFDLAVLLQSVPGQIRIRFIDYAAARHFMAQIEEWYSALEFAPESKLLDGLQRISHWLRPAFSALTAAVVLISAYFASEDLSQEDFPNISFFRLLCLLGAGLVAFSVDLRNGPSTVCSRFRTSNSTAATNAAYVNGSGRIYETV